VGLGRLGLISVPPPLFSSPPLKLNAGKWNQAAPNHAASSLVRRPAERSKSTENDAASPTISLRALASEASSSSGSCIAYNSPWDDDMLTGHTGERNFGGESLVEPWAARQERASEAKVPVLPFQWERENGIGCGWRCWVENGSKELMADTREAECSFFFRESRVF